ncbi:hypothetical protein E5676_scaffold637G00080 [Cucumis melo var. makuwa]|uniref:Protein MNN4-like n=1 Tax=Cucumis melo var. makuwa TaxID=1194695 RepID=A0A5D3CV96_CUCMM|nr:hypothetical protein E5676_scaffold637G00080 [Cucumis melo var. makuwa]
MSGKQSFTKALKKYQATLGKASPSNEAVEQSLDSEKEKEAKKKEEDNKKKKEYEKKIKEEEVRKEGEGREELISEIEKAAQSAEKVKGKDMTFKEHCKEFEKEFKNLSHLEEEAPRPKKKRKVTMKKKTLLRFLSSPFQASDGRDFSKA